MISIDDHPPSDPSSYHHHQQQQKFHDLKVSDIDLKSAVAHLDDTNNPLPNFSIREYVFSLRNKNNTACNWPFTSTSLQLCLKHGVKNLLPPFQSLDSLRNNPSLAKFIPENCLTNEELVSGFNSKPTNNLSRYNKELISTHSSGSKRDKESQIHPQRHSGQTRSKERPENVSVNTTMTSKVCPVCKIFASSSNTTLNAHIDQCLTGEGTMKWTDSPKVMVKHKVKPRKMRLMLDIYKTALHCTVEELGRRNGTSWATNYSSFPAQEFQLQEEARLTKVNHVVADIKTGSYSKKKHHKKYLKLSLNARRLCLPKARARTGREEDVKAENGSKDEQSKENMRVVDLGIIRRKWACSKLTGVSKKFNGKDRKVVIKSHQMKDLVVENHDKSDDDDNIDDDSCQSQYYDDDDTSKGSKFSPLSKNLSYPAVKFCFKRKFSAVGESRVKFVDGSSHDSSKEQSRTEEHESTKKKQDLLH